jgi:hypothetical protein
MRKSKSPCNHVVPQPTKLGWNKWDRIRSNSFLKKHYSNIVQGRD